MAKDIDSEVLNLLNRYSTERDAFSKQGVFMAAENPSARTTRFVTMLNTYTSQLLDRLPQMSIAELQAMTELLNNALNNRRIGTGRTA